jgi:TolA-binding protein
MFIRSFPSDSNIPQAMLNYGVCLLRLGDSLEAQRTFEQLVRQFPSSSQAGKAGMLVGEVLVDQEQCAEAEKAYIPVINGTDRELAAQAQLNIAACYEHNSEFEKAVSEYLKVIYVHSDQKDLVDRATYAAATIYERLEKIQEARNLYQKLANTAADPELVEQAKQKLKELQ